MARIASITLVLLALSSSVFAAPQVAPQPAAPAAPAPQPLAERAAAPSPSDAPIEATGGKSVVFAQPLVQVSGVPLAPAVPAPRLAFPKKQIEWEEITLKKPKVVKVATPISGAAPVKPLLVQLPRRALPNQIVPQYVKPGVPTQAVIARKTLLPAKTVELPEVGMWIPAQAAPVAAVSGAPISGTAPSGIPIFKKFG